MKYRIIPALGALVLSASLGLAAAFDAEDFVPTLAPKLFRRACPTLYVSFSGSCCLSSQITACGGSSVCAGSCSTTSPTTSSKTTARSTTSATKSSSVLSTVSSPSSNTPSIAKSTTASTTGSTKTTSASTSVATASHSTTPATSTASTTSTSNLATPTTPSTTSSATSETTSTSSTSTLTSSPASTSSSAAAAAPQNIGLSTGAKAGIGIGVTIGVLAIAGASGWAFFLKKKLQKAEYQLTYPPTAPYQPSLTPTNLDAVKLSPQTLSSIPISTVSGMSQTSDGQWVAPVDNKTNTMISMPLSTTTARTGGSWPTHGQGREVSMASTQGIPSDLPLQRPVSELPGNEVFMGYEMDARPLRPSPSPAPTGGYVTYSRPDPHEPPQ